MSLIYRDGKPHNGPFTASEILQLVRHYGHDRNEDGSLKEWAIGTEEEQVKEMEKTLEKLVEDGLMEETPRTETTYEASPENPYALGDAIFLREEE